MDLSREAYQLIIRHVGNRSDLCTLARVSKSFQRAAEPSLYNTLVMRDARKTTKLCSVLSAQDRLAVLVDALTVFAAAAHSDSEESGRSEEDQSDESDPALPEDFWDLLSAALRRMKRLRFLNMHINGDSDRAWILRGCTFQLRAFHSDFAWDSDLANFLNSQNLLKDLFLADYAANHPTLHQDA